MEAYKYQIEEVLTRFLFLVDLLEQAPVCTAQFQAGWFQVNPQA